MLATIFYIPISSQVIQILSLAKLSRSLSVTLSPLSRLLLSLSAISSSLVCFPHDLKNLIFNSLLLKRPFCCVTKGSRQVDAVRECTCGCCAAATGESTWRLAQTGSDHARPPTLVRRESAQKACRVHRKYARQVLTSRVLLLLFLFLFLFLIGFNVFVVSC